MLSVPRSVCSVLVWLVVTTAVWAQPNPLREPPTTPPPLVDAPRLDELPVLPETEVVGRPPAFPTTPLDDDTVLTPSRGVGRESATGSSLTVITSEQIRARGQTTVLEVLRGSVGLDVVHQGTPGSVTSAFLRGANSEHTKVLLDGIPLNNPADPTRRFDLGTLTVDNIDRIEIVRGPQSVIYGSDAMGGVINIITKRGSGPAAYSASVMGGSFGTHEERVAVSGGNDVGYYSFGASYAQSDGFSSVSRRFGGVEDDGYRNAAFSGRFGRNVSDCLNIDYVFRYGDADIDIDGFLTDNLIRQTRTEQFFNRIQLQSLAADGAVEQTVGYSLTDHALVDTDPGFFGTPRFDGVSHLFDYQVNTQVMENNVLIAGVDYLHEEASPFAGAVQRQHMLSAYIEDQLDVADWSHTAFGVRFDDHSTAGDAQTYRLTQVFDLPNRSARVHGSLGRGFKAPAISQRFGFVGNPALGPEFSKGWDAGIEKEFLDGSIVGDVTYFRNDFDNLIVFLFDPTAANGFGYLQNVQQARASGVEVTLTTYLTDATTATANYTFTDTLDQLNNQPLLRRPRNKATFGLHHRCWDDRATANVYLIYVGNRADFDALGAIVGLGDYLVLNLTGTYAVNDRWELFGRVDNLTDSDYEEVFGFSTPGISAYGGATCRW